MTGVGLRPLDSHQPRRVGFPLSQESQGKSRKFLEDQGKVRGENFYPCKVLISMKKIICTQKCV